MKNKLVLLTSILILSLLFVGCESSDVEVYNIDSPNPIQLSMEEKLAKMHAEKSSGMKPGEMPSDMKPGEMPSEQVELIVKISSALNEKVDAGELTQDEVSEIISKVHTNELSVQELMGKYGISMK